MNFTIPIQKHETSWSPFSSKKDALKRNLAYARAKYGDVTTHPWSVLAAQETISLDDVDHMQYFGDLHMGSSKQELPFMFDTGSAPVWVYSKPNCGTSGKCPEGRTQYDQTTSTDYEDKNARSQISYALGLVNGEISQDRLCMSKDNCIGSKLQFLLVDEGTNMETYQTSGFVGLAPRHNNDQLQSFIEQVKQDKDKTYNPVFSFFLASNYLADGALVFGGYDVNTFAKEGSTNDDVFWMKMLDNKFYWSVGLGDVKFANDDSALQLQSTYAILDTGCSVNMIPTEDFNKLRTQLETKGVKVTQEDGTHYVDCGLLFDKCVALPDVEIELKNGDEKRKFNIKPQNYLIKVGNVASSTYQLGFAPLDTTLPDPYRNDKVWILGDAFLSSYYSIYDWDQEQVGLIEANPNAGIKNPRKISFLVAGLVGLVLLLLCCCYCIYACIRRRNRTRSVRLASHMGRVKQLDNVPDMSHTPSMNQSYNEYYQIQEDSRHYEQEPLNKNAYQGGYQH